MYHARWLTVVADEDARRYADEALAERRKRYPPPEAALPDGDTVPVQRSLLESIVQVGPPKGKRGCGNCWRSLAKR